MNINENDVLLQHNTHKLTYAIDTVGNRRLQVYLDIYRTTFQRAEKYRDTDLCQKIVSDIIETICFKRSPNGRFFEYDEKKQIWHNVGTGAIPCQRARTGLLGLIGHSYLPQEDAEKSKSLPVLEMNKTERARTMKALHFNEKKLRAVINLKDDRFMLREDVSASPVPLTSNDKVEGKKKITHKRKRVTFAVTVDQPSKRKCKGVTPKSKKNKSNTLDVTPFDVKCDSKGIVEESDNLGNKLFHFLINTRRKSYECADDKEKFKEACRVIRLLRKIYPSSRFIHKKKNSSSWQDMSWQLMLEKTIQSFCEPSRDTLSPEEVDDFLIMLQKPDIYDNVFSEVTEEVNDIVIGIPINKEVPCQATKEIFSIAAEDEKPILIEDVDNEIYLNDTDEVLPCLANEDEDFLDVLFSTSEQSYHDVCSADEWLSTILVTN